MSDPNIPVLAHAANWQALYVEGELVDQGPDGYLDDVVETLADSGSPVERRPIDPQWLADEGTMPASIDRVRFIGGSAT